MNFRKLNYLKRMSIKSRQRASYWHGKQMEYEWGLGLQPDWFDHYIDQFYQWNKTQSPLWLERGIFALLAMEQDANVLEICCGDGFNAFHFYSNRAKNLIAVDYDKEAIGHAKKYNQAPNIEYKLCDVRTQFPEGSFDNIIWDGSVLLFIDSEIEQIMRDAKRNLKPKGIFAGHNVAEPAGGHKGLGLHDSIQTKEDLIKYFSPYFKNVKVFETIYPTRHNLYFYASDGVLPFDKNWEHVT